MQRPFHWATDEGAPGRRTKDFYGAYVRDLDGNKLFFISNIKKDFFLIPNCSLAFFVAFTICSMVFSPLANLSFLTHNLN